MNLVGKLCALERVDSDTSSLKIILPTPKKHQGSRATDSSVWHCLAFAPAVDQLTPAVD